MPVTLTVPGQPPAPPPPPPGPDYLKVAAGNADVAEALATMGNPSPPNWVELYKVYEIIEHAGALQTARQAAGISSKGLTLFARTACHPDAAGPDARHGRSRQAPPKNPMTIGTARDVVGRLLVAWMDTLK